MYLHLISEYLIHKANIDRTDERNCNTIKLGDFNVHLSIMDKTTKENINKETADLNNTIDQVNLKDIERTFHPIAAEYT